MTFPVMGCSTAGAGAGAVTEEAKELDSALDSSNSEDESAELVPDAAGNDPNVPVVGCSTRLHPERAVKVKADARTNAPICFFII